MRKISVLSIIVLLYLNSCIKSHVLNYYSNIDENTGGVELYIREDSTFLLFNYCFEENGFYKKKIQDVSFGKIISSNPYYVMVSQYNTSNIFDTIVSSDLSLGSDSYFSFYISSNIERKISRGKIVINDSLDFEMNCKTKKILVDKLPPIIKTIVYTEEIHGITFPIKIDSVVLAKDYKVYLNAPQSFFESYVTEDCMFYNEPRFDRYLFIDSLKVSISEDRINFIGDTSCISNSRCELNFNNLVYRKRVKKGRLKQEHSSEDVFDFLRSPPKRN